MYLNRSLAKQLKRWLILALTFCLGLLFGQGALWEYLHIRQTGAELALRSSDRSMSFREKQYDALLKLISLTKEYRDARTNADRTAIKEKIRLQQDIFYKLEYELAILEERKPRDICLPFLDLVPPAQPGRPILSSDIQE